MRALIIALVSLLAAPAAAIGQGLAQFPTGNSAANQYVEVVPTPGGGEPSSHVVSGEGSGEAVPSGTVRALAKHGQAGAETAALAQATAPPNLHRASARPVHHRAGSQGAGPRAGSPNSSQSSGSPASELGRALTGDATGGLGPVLPAILAATAVAGLFVLFRRRRRKAT